MMEKLIGNLKKMKSELGSPIQYYLRMSDDEVALNALMEKTITLTPTGNIHCIQCGRKTNKSFQQGFCFPCLRRLQECNLCIIHPERCQVEQGTCPVDDWAHSQCHQTHIVYLANSSGLKVGITRETQVPTRWIDQGALQAIPIFKTKNRYQAGLMEVTLKRYVNDRTDWRAMLRHNVEPIDLLAAWKQLYQLAENEIHKGVSQLADGDVVRVDGHAVTELQYPVLHSPQKINSLSLDRAAVTGRLLGIKGQYLILDTGVINIRKFGGYEIEYTIG